MEIRKAKLSELEEILFIYSNARDFMKKHGNESQWAGGYPGEATVKEDIASGRLYVCVDNGILAGVFCYFEGIEPTYTKIYGGQWLSAEPCGIIHRIAVSQSFHGRGVAAFCFEYCFKKSGSIRIDTHRDNIPMQRALQKNGFVRCGIIYLENGEERIAFQKV